MDKRGIELSVNMLVVIIISLVLLAGGIVLLNKFIGGAEELQVLLDERTEEQLQSLLIDEGQLVALSRQTITFNGEGQGIIGVGVLNIDTEAIFQLVVGLPRSLERPQGLTRTITLLSTPEPFTLEQQGTRMEPILITVGVGTPRETYVVEVEVQKRGSTYDSKKKIYIVVE